MNVRLVHQVANQPLTPENGAVSSPMRRRMIKLLDVADEADRRAETLQWMRNGLPASHHGADDVQALREEAARLRLTVSLMLGSSSAEDDVVARANETRDAIARDPADAGLSGASASHATVRDDFEPLDVFHPGTQRFGRDQGYPS